MGILRDIVTIHQVIIRLTSLLRLSIGGIAPDMAPNLTTMADTTTLHSTTTITRKTHTPAVIHTQTMLHTPKTRGTRAGKATGITIINHLSFPPHQTTPLNAIPERISKA